MLIIFIVFMIISWAVSSRMKSKFKKYSQVPVSSGLSGKEIAEKMLQQNGIFDVQVLSVPGNLTDHYNPQNKTVNLSPEVYGSSSVAAAAVASHEVGHAVQHARAYSFLELRSAMVPVQNVSAKIMNFVLIAMMFGAFALESVISIQTALIVIISCYAVMTLFTLVTLPVEFDASKRALAWVESSGSVKSGQEHDMAKNALKWAAMTYVVAALGSLAMLFYYIAIFLGNSRD